MKNRIKNGTRAWLVVSQYGYSTIYFKEDEARDQLRRTDSLFSFIISDYRDEA